MITYILIGLILYAIAVTILLLFFAGASYPKKDAVNDCSEKLLLEEQVRYINEIRSNRVDAEIAYMESLYGMDDHVRSRREESNLQ